MGSELYLVGAYVVIWAFFFGYVVRVGMKLTRIEAKIARIAASRERADDERDD